MSFSADYTDDLPAPTVTATAYGYGINSESGYIDLSWNAVPLASSYRLGIYNGSAYQYIDVGGATSYTTKNKAIWPTDAEMAAGTYNIHWSGGGQELPNIPRKDQTDINYHFTVQPANAYGQTGSSFGRANVVLPDTTPPNKPTTVSTSPAGWGNGETCAVTWAGMTDMPTNASTLGTSGHAQWVVNPDTTVDPNTWAWQNTDSNSANGSYAVSTAGLADGTHVVYIRGVDTNGNYGQPTGAELKVDKTPPTAPTVSILPTDWTKETTASLTWTSITDMTDLDRVEYAFDSGSYTTTGLADKSYSGYSLDISALSDGEHTVSVRGVDLAGNHGEAGTVTVKVDRSAPTVTSSALDPASWADTKTVRLNWAGANDPYSGLDQMEYSINGGAYVSFTPATDGSESIDISALADGQHTITLRLTDALGNSDTIDHTLYLDTTPPAVDLIAPQNGDVVTGVLDVWGGVTDISLTDWTLTAMGSSGKTVAVKTDTAEKTAEQLGVLDTGEFADGETIEVVLTAHDAAGHESAVRGVYIKADHRTKPVTAEVTITAPTQGETITTAYKEAVYTTDYSGYEDTNSYAIDGQPSGVAAFLKFPLYPILYPEGSVHGLSVISEDRGGVLHYSQGMATTLVISDIWKDTAKVESSSGLTLSQNGAEVTAASGILTSKTFTSNVPMLALRLHTIAQLAGGGSASYEYSIDGGASWQSICDGYDAYFTTPQTRVAIRANLSGTGTVLQGLDVTGIYEMSPVRFKVQLLKPVVSFSITNDSSNTKAMPSITNDDAADLPTKRLYIDGAWNSDDFTADFLPFADGSTHTVTAIGIDGSGNLHGSGAASSMLLRNTPNATGTWQSAKLELSGDTYAIRAESLCINGAGNVVTSGAYAYSFDGSTWTDFALNSYAILPGATRTLYIRATMPAGVTLCALHLEGVTAGGKAITTMLVKAPTNVQAADYGDYYENEKLRRYILTWTNPNRDDETCANDLYFDIYRNGVKIATTQKARYEDFDYVKGATYQVRARREYATPNDGLAHILTRTSRKVSATVIYIPAEQRLEGVQHNVADFTQSEYLNDLYGGNYTFSTTPNPPSVSFALDQSLLGPHRFCSLGFEPVNFNTGNFFLQTRDYSLADLGTSGFDILRTYNTQSNETDGPFGAKWATEYSQHLRLFNDGSVGYRRTDGSEIIFYIHEDGTFTNNSTEYEALSYDDARTEYRITLTDGTVYVFASGGLLKRIEEDGGQHVTEILRNEDGFITKIISPSQEELLVEMDEHGHIVKITTAGGAELRYQYSGKNLVAFTNGEGNTTKYKYDKTRPHDRVDGRQRPAAGDQPVRRS